MKTEAGIRSCGKENGMHALIALKGAHASIAGAEHNTPKAENNMFFKAAGASLSSTVHVHKVGKRLTGAVFTVSVGCIMFTSVPCERLLSEKKSDRENSGLF